MNENVLAKNYNVFGLFKFALPSIVMMMFLSLYTIIDGLFVSNFVSTTALGAVNIVFPVMSLGLGISIMISSGGSAIIAKKMGEGKDHEAREIFSFLVLMEIVFSVVLSIIGNIFINPMVSALGATEAQFDLAKLYIRIYMCFMPFAFLQNTFQVLFVAAGKPKLGLAVTMVAGVLNIFLDYLFMVVFKIGIAGAALGTVLAYLVPATVGLLYFFINKKGTLYFVKPKIKWNILGKSCINGSSEMLTNLASAITTIIFNYQCLKFYGEDGVAAITIVLYFQFIFSAVFFGLSQGVAPIVSYQYGSQNIPQLKKVFRYCIMTVGVLSIVTLGFSLALIRPISSLFCGGNQNVYQIILDDFGWYSLSLLLMGTAIYASSFFTSLGDGITSSIISFLRTLVFLVLALIFVPMIMGKTGVWFSVTIAEGLGLITAIFFLILKRKKYKY